MENNKARDKNVSKVGELPVNSRITIDYSKGKPTIDFDYPEAKRQVKKIIFSYPIFYPAFIISFMILILIMYGSPFFYDAPAFSSCSIFSETPDLFMEGSIGCISLDGSEMRFYEYKYDSVKGLEVEEMHPGYAIMDKWYYEFIMAGIWILIFFGTLKILHFFFVKTKKGQKWFPRINKIIFDKKYSVEFSDCPADKKIEIPLFKNIYLDYEATQEFSDYLQRIEIREHDFSYKVKKKDKPMKNVLLWKATFFFSKQPKEGKLTVRFT